MPLQIPPSAISQLNIPEVRPIGPLDAAAQAMGLRQGQQSLQLGALQIKKAQQAQQDEADLRQAAEAAQGDPDQIEQYLYRKNPRLADEFSKALIAKRKDQAAAAKDSLAQQKTQTEFLGQLSQGITDDASLEAARPQLEKIVPGISQQLPDFATAGPRLKQFADQALSHDKFIEAQQKAADALEKAHDAALKQGKDSQDYQDKLRKAMYESFSGVQNEQDFNDARASLKASGINEGILAEFPSYSPQVATRAATILGRKPEKPAASIQEYELAKTQGYKGSFEQWQKDEANRKNTGTDTAVSLTPAGLDVAAQAFAKTGQLPPMGMGAAGAAVRSKIINRAAEVNPGLDIAANKSDFAANQASLTQATKLKDALSSFENTALKNMQILEASGKKVMDTGSPLLNKPLRTIDEKALGNTELPVYRAARQIVVNEVAKLTGNPGLSGQLSDTARREISEILPPDITLAQLMALLPTLRQDMKNRTSSIDEQIGAIRGRIKSGGLPAPADRGLVIPGGELEKLLNRK